MGKGDIRSRRGKIWRGTYGVTRPQRWKTTTPVVPIVKPRKVKELKDLPQAVSEPVMETAVDAVNPIPQGGMPKETVVEQAVEAQVQMPEAAQPASEPVVTETISPTTPEIHETVVEETVKVKPVRSAGGTAKKKTAVKKAPAVKKPKTEKKMVAKKPAAKKPVAKKK